ncbi:hypothetical protein QR680_007174 [Steinernema hermaphroditum]|uniref:RNA-directed RNA polymerase n=1 Tax=Steinernema hermaphroditum TaxID=289476 RepID=A0AA39LYN5_9BILA|nr:hypothetical protein QR680_007174 [Steinernema hermaphroditum]
MSLPSTSTAGSFRIVVDQNTRLSRPFDERVFDEQVINKLNKPEYNVRKEHLARRVVSEFDEITYEYEMEASSTNWRTSFLPFTSQFVAEVKQLCTWPADRRSSERVTRPLAMLQIFSENFLHQEFAPCNEKVPLSSFKLGSMTDPFTFRSAHAEYPNLTEDSCFILGNFYKDRKVRHTLMANFEHDNNILFIHFPYFQHGSGPDLTVFVVTIAVTYRQIRRLIINLQHGNTKKAIIYIGLNYPIEVRRSKMNSGKGKKLTEFGSSFSRGERCRSWRKVDDEELRQKICDSSFLALELDDYNDLDLYNILSRLRVKSKKFLEFTYVLEKEGFQYAEDPTKQSNVPRVPWSLELHEMPSFSAYYSIAAMFTRGAVFKDAVLCSDRQRESFLRLVMTLCEENPMIAAAVLDQFLKVIDERRELRDPVIVLKKLKERVMREKDSKAVLRTQEMNDREGYIFVRKVVVTPTRILLMPAELMMGNRALRDFAKSGENAIRIQFRDDDGLAFRTNKMGKGLIERTISEFLRDGLIIKDKHFMYVGSSNSQLRDNGCYFFEKSEMAIIKEKIMKHLDKEKFSVPKRMSRLGLYFTQAQRVTRGLKREEYLESFDFVGGNDLAGKPYTFSDGVGMISYRLAKEFAENLKLKDFVPSCIQFRYRGMKGVLSVNPVLDELNEWATINIADPKKRLHYSNNVVFRSSNKKFNTIRSKRSEAPFEVVKYSAPCRMALNRPILDILDQVAEMQSYEILEKIYRRVDELFEKQVLRAASCLTSERDARERLAELPKRIGISYLREFDGFLLTEEPFFRSLVMCTVRQSLRRLRMKSNIEIPSNKGRLVFGIVDESGQLQYDQVFCQISENVFNKHPGKAAKKIVLKGPVMMTKNPSIVAGDVRVFNAVDIPELRHLVDVVVFPKYGPRPQPDEMAGSDLDGDEYAIFWDDQLLFERSEEPIHFPRHVTIPEDVPEEQLEEEMRKFFVDYIVQDAVGVLAHAFLANSDFYGINSRVALEVAQKHATALDFPKTGKAPESLSARAERVDGIVLPPEKPDRYPDFMEKDHRKFYVSLGLNGYIYRRAKLMDNIVHRSSDRYLCSKIALDPELIVEGWNEYEEVAKSTMEEYNAQMRHILETYGIEDEAQLLSGYIMDFKARVGGAVDSHDLFGAFNVNNTVNRNVTTVFDSFRRQFFENFGGYERCTDFRDFNKPGDHHDMYERVCAPANVTLEMKKMASAYYKVTYETAQMQGSQSVKFLSFPWIAWDILSAIKRHTPMNERTNKENYMTDPFASRLTTHIERFCASWHDEYKSFEDVLMESDILSAFIEQHTGLLDIMFFLCTWADDAELFSSSFTYQHLCFILIMYGLDKFSWKPKKFVSFLNPVHEVSDPDAEPLDLNSRIGGLGFFILDFLEFLSSSHFAQMKVIDFYDAFSVKSFMDTVYLKKLREAALSTFREVAFSVSFDDFPQVAGEEVQTKGKEIEIESFKIELPHAEEKSPETGEVKRIYSLEQVEDKIKEKTGVSHVRVRQCREYRGDDGVGEMIVSARGTIEALEKLRILLSTSPQSRAPENYEWGRLFLAERILANLDLEI